MNNENYLDKHRVKVFKNCTQYGTVKACVIASLKGELAYYKDHIYYYKGKIQNVNFIQTEGDIELPLFAPTDENR